MLLRFCRAVRQEARSAWSGFYDTLDEDVAHGRAYVRCLGGVLVVCAIEVVALMVAGVEQVAMPWALLVLAPVVLAIAMFVGGFAVLVSRADPTANDSWGSHSPHDDAGDS